MVRVTFPVFFIALVCCFILTEHATAQTWTAQTSGTGVFLRSVSFVSASVAYVVGGDAYASRTIKKSTDGGASWSAQSTPSDAYAFKSVSFTDISTGTAVGDIGTIVRTVNGGTTWTFQYNTAFDNYQTLYAVDFHDATNGITVGVSGRILWTTNGGSNWNTPAVNPASVYLYGVAMADANTAVAVGENGTIIRTTDSGNNWTSITSGTANHLTGVSFGTVSAGAAVGLNGTILRTTDGGATWSDQSGGSNGHRAVCFTDANNGTVVGDGGIIKRTVNGGTQWTTQTSNSSATLTGVSFLDGNAGLVSGSGGVILLTADGSTPVELTSFTAVHRSAGAELRWNTATEVNNLGFEIQRSPVNDRLSGTDNRQLAAEGRTWDKAGFMEGQGNSNSPREYTFTDRSLTTGTYLYRLKQIDRDAHFTYSPAVEVTIADAPTTFNLEQNYPNPFNPSTSIRFSVPELSAVRVEVFDILGRNVAVLFDGTMEQGTRQAVWHADAAAGIYLCRIECRSLTNSGSRFSSVRRMQLLK